MLLVDVERGHGVLDRTVLAALNDAPQLGARQPAQRLGPPARRQQRRIPGRVARLFRRNLDVERLLRESRQRQTTTHAAAWRMARPVKANAP